MPIKKFSLAGPHVRKPSATSLSSSSSSTEVVDKAVKMHKRSRSGCFTCRIRRKKCDEGHPSCGACINLCVRCEYKRPAWWANADQRRIQKERIKNKIKQTKANERNGISKELRGATQSVDINPLASPKYDLSYHDLSYPSVTEPYDIFSSYLSAPTAEYISCTPYGPYEVDVKTESRTFISDVPLRHGSATSTFNPFSAPFLSASLPTFPEEDIFLFDEYLASDHMIEGISQTAYGRSIQQSYALLKTNIPVSDSDRPLLDHFIHNVLRLIFPVLEINQREYTRIDAILHALETNKCYLHCCLSIAAIHLKTTEGLVGDHVDHAVVRHRYEAVSQLCQALGEDADHQKILDATLAMIFFHCAVGSADDYLPDIPWYDHFQAASNLVYRLDLSAAISDRWSMLPPFSMTLASWIDILGSTMVGKTPHFAHTYRSKHLNGSALGFRELMGCDDRVMYLISEIACLDTLKHEGRIDSLAVCSHVSALGAQLEFTEPADQTLENPLSSTTNAVRRDVLSKNMTMIFRTAARIYLCSLVPGFDRNQPSNLNLVSAVANALSYIPSGPNGFDRSLVWPLLITGAFSTSACRFRTVLAERSASLASHMDLGSYGRMCRVLQEVWRVTDGDDDGHYLLSDDVNSIDPTLKQEEATSAGISPPLDEVNPNDLRWRKVMRQNGWRYLLI